MKVSARSVGSVVTLTWFAGYSVFALAQAPAEKISPSEKMITVDIVVDAKSGKSPVGGLQEQDFTILDNKAPRPLTSFRAVEGQQAPIRVVVLVDAVNVRTQDLGYERAQMSTFLHANQGQLAHPISLAILTDKGLQTQSEFSRDGNALSKWMDKQQIGMRTIRGDMGIYGAEDRLGISLNGLRTLAIHDAGQDRLVVLWISPGWPLLSGPGMQLSDGDQKKIFDDVVNVSSLLREAHMTLYAVDPIGTNEGIGRTFQYESYLKGVAKPAQVDVGDLALQVLAVQSGGVALNSNDVAATLQKCVSDLDGYYEISFEPAPAETRYTYHHLEVRLDKPGMTARTRDGYYALP